MLGAPPREICTRGHLMAETRKRHPNGDAYCSACKTIRSVAEARAHPERRRRYHRKSKLLRTYGLAPEDVDGKPCAICGTTTFNGRGPNVDHDHETGAVRGILCHNCNTGLGLLGENLEAAMEYLAMSKAGKAKKKK